MRERPYFNSDDDMRICDSTAATRVLVMLGGVLVGLALGSAGGMLVADAFLDAFCVDYGKSSPAMCRAPLSELPSVWLAFLVRFNVALFAGCVAGALGARWLANAVGHRVTSFSTLLLAATSSLGTALVPAHAHTLLLVGRVVQGMGVGGASLSLSLFAAEFASSETGGIHSSREPTTVAVGLLLANFLNIVVENTADGWRYTTAATGVPALVSMLLIACVSESPTWRYKTRGRESARSALQALRCPTSDVDDELDAIDEQITADKCRHGWCALWALEAARRRLVITAALAALQQTTGISVVFVYGGLIFNNVVGDGVLSLSVLSVVFSEVSKLAVRVVNVTRRRWLFALGAAGMSAGHLAAAVVLTTACADSTDGGVRCLKPPRLAVLSAAALFVFSFAVAWEPACRIYSTEILPRSLRSRAATVSSVLNWSAGALMVSIPELFPRLDASSVFFLLAALCIAGGVFAFSKCPETKGLAMEEIDALFGDTLALEAMSACCASDPSLTPSASSKFVAIATPDPAE